MTTPVAEFDRSNPLFERNIVSFEVVTQSPNNNNSTNAASSNNDNNNNNNNNNIRNGNFTVRILEGRRSGGGGGDGERVIRFEMSNECNLVGDLPTHQHQQYTPSRSRTPIIHAPFMTVDRGGGQGHHSTMMQGGPNHHHQSPHTRSSHIQLKSLNLPIELYELEVGESDFAALRRDQALLVDFNSFSDSLISLLQCCELGSEENEGSWSSTHHQTFQDTNSNQYGQQQQPYDESASGGWNGGQGGGVSRQSMTGQQQWGSSNTNNGSWSTPSHQQQGMNYHGQRMMSSPFTKMNCSTSSMPVSTYACRLEVDAQIDSNSMQQWRQNSTQQSNNNSYHARFSIVESNQFRELTHLALNLNVGTDKSVRCFLSSRYDVVVHMMCLFFHFITDDWFS